MAHVSHTTKTLGSGVRALVAGKGPVIICVAGWPQTAESFLDILPALSENHRVLVLDPPGLGDSAPSSGGIRRRLSAGYSSMPSGTKSAIVQATISSVTMSEPGSHLAGLPWTASSFAQ
ncbi:hypothetical protein V2G26_010351 [Clonostachys chloroleuca]